MFTKFVFSVFHFFVIEEVSLFDFFLPFVLTDRMLALAAGGQRRGEPARKAADVGAAPLPAERADAPAAAAVHRGLKGRGA